MRKRSGLKRNSPAVVPQLQLLSLRGRALQTRRLRLWAIDPNCKACGTLTNYPDGFQLDHKVPLFKGGADEDENLQVLCIKCHDAKTMKDTGKCERLAFDDSGHVQW